MGAAVNQVTIEALEEIFEHDAICRTVVTSGVNLFGWKPLRRRVRCTRKAWGTILLTCSEHGTRKIAMCRFHLWVLRWPKGSYELTCGGCGQRAIWRD